MSLSCLFLLVPLLSFFEYSSASINKDFILSNYWLYLIGRFCFGDDNSCYEKSFDIATSFYDYFGFNLRTEFGFYSLDIARGVKFKDVNRVNNRFLFKLSFFPSAIEYLETESGFLISL